MRFFWKKSTCREKIEILYYNAVVRGRSSVVERHVANVNVVSSNLIARFKDFLPGMGGRRSFRSANPYSIGEIPAKRSLALVSDMFKASCYEP